MLQSKAMRRVLGETMDQVKEEEATNDEIRRRLGSVPKVEGARRSRKLLLGDRAVRMKSSKHPKTLLAAARA